MSEQKLREELAQLKSVLQQAQLPEPQRQAMQQLLSDMEIELDSNLADRGKEFVEQLEQQVAEFEVNHPTLAGVINNLLLSLSNMGI